jgi:hypothetical protein
MEPERLSFVHDRSAGVVTLMFIVRSLLFKQIVS